MSTFKIKRGKKAVIELSSSSVKLLIGPIGSTSLNSFKTLSERTKTTDGLQGNKMNLSWYQKNVLPTIIEYKNICDKEGVNNIVSTATAVYRKSANCSEVFDLVEEAIGVRPILLSGQQEAELAPLSYLTLNKNYRGWILFIDQGRGSTELSLVSPQRIITKNYSIPHGNNDIREMGVKNIVNDLERNKEVQNILSKAIKNDAILVASGGILTKNAGFEKGSFISENSLKEDIFCIFKYIMQKTDNESLQINVGDSTLGAFYKYD